MTDGKNSWRVAIFGTLVISAPVTLRGSQENGHMTGPNHSR